METVRDFLMAKGEAPLASYWPCLSSKGTKAENASKKGTDNEAVMLTPPMSGILQGPDLPPRFLLEFRPWCSQCGRRKAERLSSDAGENFLTGP